jgi:hypothetical protein
MMALFKGEPVPPTAEELKKEEDEKREIAEKRAKE